MEKVRNFRELIVWQRAMELTKQSYKFSSTFPKEELFGLVSQIRRAAVSVAANIAEGQARNTTGEFRQFLGISRGSLAELETLVILAQQLGFLDDEKSHLLLGQAEEINKMIHGLLKSLPSPH
ncbi:MAG: four helix bundle protein [Bacteroidales bacterium]|nr:four helix bundle protein [Bacteroidales bacterium]MDD3666164.1 four helix bundle protein [Bacteroidales bacterium]